MQPLRGTKDILPDENILWQYIRKIITPILSSSNYNEITTPIIENTELFQRSIGKGTDIINKEMYSFSDQGQRNITLRPEGTASIARAFISNKMYNFNSVNRLWYLGPMFRYERPQHGRQRQFHQLGIECIGSHNPIADVEVIRLATRILNKLEYKKYQLEINSIGKIEERAIYKNILVNYLQKYTNDLDKDSKVRIKTNPLRILDSKCHKTQEIIHYAPKLISCLKSESREYFDNVCELLNSLAIPYNINYNLVRGLDYYNDTAFEIKTQELGSQDTICGGGRYDSLIKQLGGPNTPSVGWAIGLERLIMLIKNEFTSTNNNPYVYLINQNLNTQKYMWTIMNILEEQNIKFELDLSITNFSKKLKKAYKSGAKKCIIIGENEVQTQTMTIKDLQSNDQNTIKLEMFIKTSHFN
uniref:histidine--tRNA ligase n=1 Tax=Campylaephora sungminbooi TaxID=1896769 RepID=A0A1B0TI24_9FLOR|nr:histidine tRNA synthetase [Campylaephora sungminbooi]AKU47368.1 histidine tRNA synthetase [Campylaephora sungminbooi]ALN11815.1 histidine tRNA synthetase [Campylaephora sungminbooi]